MRDAERATAGDDGDLVHRVAAGEQLARRWCDRLVHGGVPALLLAHDHGAALGAHHHLVLRELEVDGRRASLFFRAATSAASFTRFSRSAPRSRASRGRWCLEIDVGSQRRPLGVHAEDALATTHVGTGHHDAPVETAGAEERRVEHVRAVRRGDDDDAFGGLEAVHLHEELVQRLLALVVTTAEPGAAVTTDGVDLVDEDDAGRVALALLEQIAHAAGADADEHLHEVRARDGEERHACLARDGLARAASCRFPASPSAARPWGSVRRGA